MAEDPPRLEAEFPEMALEAPGSIAAAGASRGPTRLRLAASVAAILGVIVLGGCTKHEERYVTPWLKVDIARPVTGTSGVIVLGSSEELFRAKVGDRWVRMGAGHPSRYMTLADDQAVLIDFNDRKGLQLVRAGDGAPRPVRDAFGSGDVQVPPDRAAVDVFECRVPATPAGCREVQIDRYDVAGTLLASFPVELPEAYSDCQLLRIAGYDKDRIPYVFGQCRMNSAQAKCVVLAPQKARLFVYAVGPDQPWIECSELRRVGVSLREPERFTGLM